MRPSAVLAAALVVGALLGGCSAAPPPAEAPPVPSASPPAAHLPAASPADSPPLTVAPAGVITPVGAAAEGVVVDPSTRTVAVGVRDPDGLVLADADTGRVRSRIPLPGHLRHLQTGGPGVLLVPDEDSGRLLTVALPGGAVAASLPIGVSPHYAVTAPDGTVFVADEAGHRVAVVRGGAVTASLPDAVMPGGMAIVGGRLGVVDVFSDTLTLYDTGSLARLATVPLGAGPTHEVADDRGDLVVMDTRAEAVLFATADVPPRVRLTLPLPGSPYGAAYDRARDRLWVTLTGRNELVGLDTRSDPPREIARIPTVRQPDTVAVDEATGRLLVTGTADGLLQTVDGPP